MAPARLQSLTSRYEVRYLAIALFSFFTFGFVTDHVVNLTPINGTSMNPTLSPHIHETGQKDRILWQVWKCAEKLERGDVILFRSPSNPEKIVTKRIVATGGDTVYLDSKRCPGYGKDVLSPEEVIAFKRWSTYNGKVIVPYGHLWVEGDNWRVSADSNRYGPISKSLVIGKAWRALWPANIMFTQPWVGYDVRTRVDKGMEVLPREWAD